MPSCCFSYTCACNRSANQMIQYSCVCDKNKRRNIQWNGYSASEVECRGSVPPAPCEWLPLRVLFFFDLIVFCCFPSTCSVECECLQHRQRDPEEGQCVLAGETTKNWSSTRTRSTIVPATCHNSTLTSKTTCLGSAAVLDLGRTNTSRSAVPAIVATGGAPAFSGRQLKRHFIQLWLPIR